MIEGISKEEANLIAFEFLDELHTFLCQCRVTEGLRLYREIKNNIKK